VSLNIFINFSLTKKECLLVGTLFPMINGSRVMGIIPNTGSVTEPTYLNVCLLEESKHSNIEEYNMII